MESIKIKRSCTDPFYFNLLFEYVDHVGLKETALVLKEECKTKGFPAPHDISLTDSCLKSKLLKTFDNGDGAVFFEELSTLPIDISLETFQFKKLICDLHVHFAFQAITALRKAQAFSRASHIEISLPGQSATTARNSSDESSLHPAINRLLKFLNQSCDHLRLNPDFVQYFSLPLTDNIFTHSLFYQASQDVWVSKLRMRLDQHLQCHPTFKIPDIVLYLPPILHPCEEPNDLKSSNLKVDSSHLCLFHEDSHDIVEYENRKKNEEWYHGTVECTRSNTSENRKESVLSSADICCSTTTMYSDKLHEAHTHDSAFFTRRCTNEDTLQEAPYNVDLNTYDFLEEDMKFRYVQLQEKFSQLHSDYHNLIGVASELASVLESNVRGQQIDLRQTLNNCIRIFPGLFSFNHHEEQTRNKPSRGMATEQANLFYLNLNVNQIKIDLFGGSVKSQLLLLQAVRWAISKSCNRIREGIVKQFVAYDILNLEEDSILTSLLLPAEVLTPHPLQQSAARLLNALASIQLGRSYLSQNTKTVNVTSAVLQQHDGVQIDTFTKNMLVAALQKLSLRRNQRIAMIRAGIVGWLFEQFSVIDGNMPYFLEYGSALLMNLLLHQSAKEHCISKASRAVKILMDLLSTPITQALPYINGALFSIVTHPQLNEVAAEVGLAATLAKHILEQANTEMKKQLEHILHYHQSLLHCKDTFLFSTIEGEMIDEDGEELDLLGEELDEEDPVRSLSGELFGEDLLCSYFTGPISTQGNSKEITSIETCSLPLRPKTPHQYSRHTAAKSAALSDIMTVGPVDGKSQESKVRADFYLRKVEATHQERSTDFKTQSLGLDKESSNGIEDKTTLKEMHTESLMCPKINKAEHETIKKLPEICIQLVSNMDTDDKDNGKDLDEDSDDVQVASLPNAKVTDINVKVHEFESGSKSVKKLDKGDVAAPFASCPKMPRTPPHNA